MTTTHPAPRPPSDRLLDEGLLSIVDAAAADGIDITAKTALRWSLNGRHGVRLESIKVAGRRMTSRAAIRRFIAATQPDDVVPPVPALDAAGADRVLAAHGLGRGGRR